MGKTNIEWAEETWSPVTGCTPISAGCLNCYAKRLAEGRLRGRCGYPRDNPFGVTLHPKRMEDPLKWKKPRKIFVCSMGDLFHPDVPLEFISKILEVITKSTQHTFIILTKRPERMNHIMLAWKGGYHHKIKHIDDNYPLRNTPPNLWLGVTAESQADADKRIPILLDIPAAKRFVSVEPMLDGILLDNLRPDKFTVYNALVGMANTSNPNGILGDVKPNKQLPKIDWVICGGENATNARTMNPDWVRSLRDQCENAEVPFFFKSWGEYMPFNFSYGKWCRWKNKKDPARYQIDGKQYREYP